MKRFKFLAALAVLGWLHTARADDFDSAGVRMIPLQKSESALAGRGAGN